jgi:hypothetical protein
MKVKGTDVVTGKPIEKKHSLIRNFGSMIQDYLFCIILKKPKSVRIGSPFLIKRNIVNAIINDTSPNPMLGALVLRHTLNISSVSVRHDKRMQGKSNYSIVKLFEVLYDLLIQYSTLPLRVVSWVGFVSAFLGMLGILLIISSAIQGEIGVAGWTSIISLICFLGGLILFSFGIMGEYLIRILQEVSRQVQYTVRDSKL